MYSEGKWMISKKHGGELFIALRFYLMNIDYKLMRDQCEPWVKAADGIEEKCQCHNKWVSSPFDYQSLPLLDLIFFDCGG